MVTAVLILSFVIVAVVFFRAEHITPFVQQRFNISLPPHFLFSGALLLLFILQLCLGITGSSSSLLTTTSPHFLSSNETTLWGNAQPIRNDEHAINTPFAMMQYNSVPPFPVINHNLGEDGQNMLVIHETGVPVKHLSALAKPATWGFFIFDLRRAISWYWLFPLYACLLALWAVVATISNLDWRNSFLFALCFCVAPYTAAWSNWPAYAVFFPSLAFVCVVSIFKTESTLAAYLSGLVLGCAVAGDALILYPPWQIALGYLFALLLLGIFIQEKLYLRFNRIHTQGLVLGAIIASVILYAWWKDAYPAIDAMLRTVYPGNRTLLTGGTLSFASILKGFTNLVTLYNGNLNIDNAFAANDNVKVLSNQSEIASFYYFLLPLLLLFVRQWRCKNIDVTSWLLLAFIAFVIIYMSVGIPPFLSKISLWGRVPDYRADIALGLGCLLLSAILLGKSQKNSSKIIAWLGSILWAIIAICIVISFPENIRILSATDWIIVLSALVTLLGYYLISGQTKPYVYSLLALSLASTAFFNPITIAPDYLTVNDQLKNILGTADTHKKILVLSNIFSSQKLAAAGYPVISTVYSYPQTDLWTRLDPQGLYKDIYNRYYRLRFVGMELNTKIPYKITLLQTDAVGVMFDWKRFDFNLTGATFIASVEKDDAKLSYNYSIRKIGSTDGYSWYKVISPLEKD